MLFHYTVINNEGIKVEADIEADSLDAAVAVLQKRSVTIVDIEEKQQLVPSFSLGSVSFFKTKIKAKDVVIFSRQISTLFEAGVSALKAFRLLSAENDNKELQKQLTGVADDIESGVSISDALSRKPDIFSSFYVNMVRSGEESGKLNESFSYLADYLDRDYELRQKVKKALTYPAFVVATFVTIMIVMFTFVIPKMAAMFADQGVAMPLVTKIVLGISDIFVKYWLITFPILILLGWLGYRWSQTPEGARKVDEIKVRLPVIKVLYQRIFLTRLADNMNTMLSSGVPIVRSIDITAEVLDNIIYKELLFRVSKKVQSGTAFSKALYEESLVPNILVQMVRIGEETGELGFILKNLAMFYKRELDTAIDNVIGLIEPAMIVGLGLAVGILVSSVLLPMYSLSASIS